MKGKEVFTVVIGLEQKSEITDLWSAEWGYKALFSCFLFLTDREGRFIICDIKAYGKVLTLANICSQ